MCKRKCTSRLTATYTGANGSSNGGGGGEKRPNGSDAGNMSLIGGGPGRGIASRTGGRSGNGTGTGSHSTTGGITGGSWGGDNSTAASRCPSAPDAKRFLRLYITTQCIFEKTENKLPLIEVRLTTLA